MKKLFTVEDFDNLLKTDKEFKAAWDEHLKFEKWLALHPRAIQEEVDKAMRESLKLNKP